MLNATARHVAGALRALGAPCLPFPQALPGLPDVFAVTLVTRPVLAPGQDAGLVITAGLALLKVSESRRRLLGLDAPPGPVSR
jgi:hypothetical protein